MAYRLRCDTCGKLLTATAGDAGSAVLCGACGARVTVPRDVAAAGPPAPVRPTVVVPVPAPEPSSRPSPRSAAPAVPTPVRVPTPATVAPSTSPARRSVARPLTATILIAGIGAAVAGGILLGRRGGGGGADGPATTAVVGHADLIKLKADAEALALDGRLAEAHAAYRQLATAAAGRAGLPPAVREAIARARTDQDRIYAILLARQNVTRPSTAAGADAGAKSASSASPRPTTNPDSLWDGPPETTDAAAARPATAPSTIAALPPAAAVGPTTLTPATSPASGPATRPFAPPAVARADLPFAPVPAGLEDPAVLDARVEQAVRRGVDFLLTHFTNSELPPEAADRRLHSHGLHALCTFAAASAGRVLDDPRLGPRGEVTAGLIDRLKQYPLETPTGNKPFQPVVYARALRIAALAVHNRDADAAVIRADAAWLLAAHVNGAYGYDDRIVHPRSLPPIGDAREPGPLRDADGRPIGLADGRHDPRTGREVDPQGVRGAWEQYLRSVPAGVHQVWKYYVQGADPSALKLIDPAYPDYNMLWDFSNSEYGVMGVAAASDLGLVAGPPGYWRAVADVWGKYQLRTGQWPYMAARRTGTLAMTCGGIASVLAAGDRSPLDRVAAAAGDPSRFAPAVYRALAWLTTGDNVLTAGANGSRYAGYDLFSLSRAGEATGFKHLGSHDWYRAHARRLVEGQRADGSWATANGGAGAKADAVIETAYAVLFLARHRGPVVMNKLQFAEKDALRRSPELPPVARFAGRAMERPLGWQVVDGRADWAEWTDAPILYLAAPGLAPPAPDYAKLRRYVETGGMLLLQGGSFAKPFDEWAAKVVSNVCRYELTDLPADHPVYRTVFPIGPEAAGKLKLRGADNGSRLLVVVSPTDLGSAWRSGDEAKAAPEFQLAANLYAYAVGRAVPRSRLAATAVPAPATRPAVTLKVARLTYAGNWDPEPGAWPRLSNLLAREARATIEATAVPAAGLTPGSAPLAHLTGTAATPQPTDAEVAALRAYVAAGGVLLVDPCGGSPAFLDAVERQVLPAAFPGLGLRDAPWDEPPLARGLDAMDDLTRPRVRPSARERAGAAATRPSSASPATFNLRVASFGKGWVVVSPLDLTTGLTGSDAWGVAGYEPTFAKGVVKNVLLWAATRERG